MSQIDWTTADARGLAKLCRAEGLRCRVVRSKYRDTKVHVYRESADFEQRWQKALRASFEQGLVASYCIVKVES